MILGGVKGSRKLSVPLNRGHREVEAQEMDDWRRACLDLLGFQSSPPSKLEVSYGLDVLVTAVVQTVTSLCTDIST